MLRVAGSVRRAQAGGDSPISSIMTSFLVRGFRRGMESRTKREVLPDNEWLDNGDENAAREVHGVLLATAQGVAVDEYLPEGGPGGSVVAGSPALLLVCQPHQFEALGRGVGGISGGGGCHERQDGSGGVEHPPVQV